MSLNLRTLGGRLLITVIQSSSAVAQRVLATSCECCRYCCRAIGLPDECGNYQQSCRSCPDGLRRSCDEPCPERPPCILQCVEIDETPCGDPVYDCPVYDTEIIGIPVESCEECPEPPPCDEYYCCYEFEPSQNPESPLPPRNCQIGPCSAPELYSSGPHPTLVQCAAACENWYCCYTEQPSQNPEVPLPPSACQLGPCASIELQRSGPHYTLQACQNACKTYYCCYIEQPSENPEIPLPPSLCQVGPCAAIELQKSGPHQTLAECQQDCPPECVYACYCHPGAGGAGWVVQDTPCSTSGQNCCTYHADAACSTIVATTTINKPPAFAGLVVSVTITGIADDDIAIDGVVAGPPCRAAAAVNHAFTMAANDPSFDLGVVDNFGACVHATLTICFATSCAARTQPTVTVVGTSGNGTGAMFDVTLSQSQDTGGFAVWSVSSVTMTGGTGYQTGDTLTFAIAQGDTQDIEAQAHVSPYTEPTLSLSVAGGTGAVLQIDGYTVSGDYWGFDFADTWRISGITVANGGTGYTNDTLVTVNLGLGDEARPGAGSDLRIRTGFRAPNDDWTLQNGNPAPTGTGLALSLTLVAHPTVARTFWVNSWAITNGGTGYAVGQRIRPLANEGNNAASPLRANLEITAVDSNGSVTALDLFGTTTSTRNTSRGRYSIETGVITSVVNLLTQAGWRKAVDDGVVVTNGGHYYRCEENPFP